MATTANGLAVGELTDAPNIPGLDLLLANSVDARYGLTVANFAALAGITAPFDGMQVWATTEADLYTYDGTNWLPSGLGAWTAYTPVGGAGLTSGNGTWSGRWQQVGAATVRVHVRFVLGSTSSISNAITITLPVAARDDNEVCLTAHVLDSSAGAPGRLPAVAIGNGAGTIGVYSPSGSFSATVPFTWATGDIIQFSGVYEIAV